MHTTDLNRSIFQEIVEHADDIIYRTNVEGYFEYVNAAAIEATGLKEIELIGSYYLDLIPESHKRLVKKFNYEHFKKRKTKSSFKFPIQNKNGTLVWLDQNLITVWDDSRSEIHGFSAIARDISEQIKLEKKIQESERSYSALFRNAPIPKRLEDFSQVKTYLNELKSCGIKDFRKYFDENPDEVKKCAEMVVLIEENEAVADLFEAENVSVQGDKINKYFNPSLYENFKIELVAIANGAKEFEGTFSLNTKKGNEKFVQLRWAIVPGYEESLERVIITANDITDLIIAQKEIIANQEKLTSVFETLVVPIVILDPDTAQIVQVNNFTLEFLGYTENEILNMTMDQVDAQHDLAYIKHSLSRYLTEGNVKGETKWITKSGEIRHVSINNSMLRYGGKDLIIVAAQDITELMHLMRENQRFRFAMDNAPFGIYIADIDENKIVDINSTGCDQLGYTREELMKLTLEEIEVEDPNVIKEERYAKIGESLATGEPITVESIHKRKDGSAFPVNVTLSALQLGGINHLVACAFDNSEIEDLSAQNQRFRKVMDDSPFAIYITDLEQDKFIDVNNTASKHLGYSREELLEMRIQDIELMDMIQNKEERLAHFQRMFDEGELTRVEGVHLRKDGTTFPVLVNVKAEQIMNRKYIIASIFDNTAEKEIQDKLAEQHTILKNIHSLQSAFVSTDNLKRHFFEFLERVIFYSKSEFGFILELSNTDNDDIKYIVRSNEDFRWTQEERISHRSILQANWQQEFSRELINNTVISKRSLIIEGGNNEFFDPRKSVNNFLGIPIRLGEETIGIIGLGNREGNYNNDVLEDLNYFIDTCSVMIQARRFQREQEESRTMLSDLNRSLKSEIEFANDLQAKLFIAEETERKRIARELHDSLGQRLTAAKFSLGAIKNSGALDDSLNEILSDTIEYIQDSMQEVRQISHNLVPSVLSDFGLGTALERLVKEFSHNKNVLFTYTGLKQVLKLSDLEASSLYRIAQEAVYNSIKHSKCTKIDLSLQANNQVLELVVKDNGVGFNSNEEYRGMGMKNMIERASAIKACLTIDSLKNKGTQIKITLNL
ncbi:MAG: PAS domain S-box protein [Crocinitomicaceae bacterium]|nr:PAS domain S-box protein [Crocinitomicaceae bacterium]